MIPYGTVKVVFSLLIKGNGISHARARSYALFGGKLLDQEILALLPFKNKLTN